jgi:hypothetical protein
MLKNLPDEIINIIIGYIERPKMASVIKGIINYHIEFIHKNGKSNPLFHVYYLHLFYPISRISPEIFSNIYNIYKNEKLIKLKIKNSINI